MSIAADYHFSDFTEGGYDHLLDVAKLHYRFEPFGTKCVEQHALWRHDIDISVHRALRCALSEAERGVRSTYFLLLHSEFYNLLEYSVLKAANQILAAGHWLGLHFDPTVYTDCDRLSGLEERVYDEKRLLERVFGTSVDAVSYHRPTVSNVLNFDQARIGGLWNAYSNQIKTTYCYMSDSNGYWRFQRVPDVLKSEDRPAKLHLLTHPEWWTRDAMSPRKRVITAVEGRSNYVLSLYDQELKIHGRANVD